MRGGGHHPRLSLRARLTLDGAAVREHHVKSHGTIGKWFFNTVQCPNQHLPPTASRSSTVLAG